MSKKNPLHDLFIEEAKCAIDIRASAGGGVLDLPDNIATIDHVQGVKSDLEGYVSQYVGSAIESIEFPDVAVSDFEQNDETAADFIKNKPFYSDLNVISSIGYAVPSFDTSFHHLRC